MVATGAGISIGGATGAATGAGVATGATAPSSMTASSAPTATVASTATTILVRVPLTGEGISVSTLSVDTSSSGSSTLTWSPSDLSHRVTVPSVTLSPSAGIVNEKVMVYFSYYPCA